MLKLDRDICLNLDAVLQREWLVTNGLGSYASGTGGRAAPTGGANGAGGESG